MNSNKIYIRKIIQKYKKGNNILNILQILFQFSDNPKSVLQQLLYLKLKLFFNCHNLLIKFRQTSYIKKWTGKHADMSKSELN